MEDSIFIEILKHGEEKGLKGTAFHALKSYLSEKGLIPEPLEQIDENRLHKLYTECFDEYHTGPHGSRILKTEYYFRLIEYRELQEARKASKDANRNSFIAISIAVFAIITSGILTYFQVNNPIEIEENQFSKILTKIESDKVQKIILDESEVKGTEGLKINQPVISGITNQHDFLIQILQARTSDNEITRTGRRE